MPRSTREQDELDNALGALEDIRDVLADDDLEQDEAVERAADIADTALDDDDDACWEDDDE
jgi:hypothetical protein